MAVQDLKTDFVVDRYEYSGPRTVEDAFVFLHGFPGRFTRNEDLAQFCAAKLQGDAFVPQYRGLGRSPGEFLFSVSIYDSVSLLQQISAQNSYKRLHPVGHSWGGFVALSCLHLSKVKIDKTLLLSPYTVAPPPEAFHPELRSFVEVQKLTGKKASDESLISDLDFVLEEFLPQLFNGLKDRSSQNTLVLQAAQDQTMPAIVNKGRFSSLSGSLTYKEIPDNHWFTTRAPLFSEVEAFFRRKDV